ncbi:AraC family transcriptional regulator [Flavihumibacter solisilvae]|uniref:AraC family transcriptional regulator n=1 Tax=Flavihumibacter solisilvae TaxID=1349421 RepID=A0A0C1L7W5_9BACT|nr:AraC family transcriptional regulator [Flavihumibacter solisilvae]KIC96242.1 AraC family transcriptional regulator [Flavihumibacter solisilvae]
MDRIPVRRISPALKEPAFTGGFNIRDLGILLHEQDLVQELHRHDFYYVLALANGKGKHEIDFTAYPVGNCSVYFLRPGQVHHLTLKKGSKGIMMGFDNTFYSPQGKSAIQGLRKVSSKNYCKSGVHSFNKLYAALTSILEEFNAKQERYYESIRAYMEIFFIELARQSRQPGSPLNGNNSYTQERLEELLELLDTHLKAEKQVAQYAGRMHLTPYQLNAITKSTLGKTCSDLINERIILEAKRLLLATSEQVNQVADHLGYEDVSYFIRFFKKHTGFTPETFRNSV